MDSPDQPADDAADADTREGATDSDDATDPPGERQVSEPTDLLYVGPATADRLAAADVDPADVLAKRVSHAQLLAAGVNAGVAAKIRRHYSLSWSFESSGEDLSRRAAQVRGLDDDERAWVQASAGDWENADVGATADGSGAVEAEEAAWRDRSKPDPVTAIHGIGPKRAERLAEAGIRSVRSLANADPAEVAESLALNAERVSGWCDEAREQL